MRKKNIFKKVLSVFTAMAMALSLMTGIPFSEINLGIEAFAATTTYDFSTNPSPLTINSSNKDQYDGATITGSLTLDTAGNIADILVIDGVTVNLTIEDLTLTTYLASTNGYSPIDLTNGATLNLTVKGNNTLTVGWHAAGIHVPEGCTLNITSASTGTLTVNGGGGYGGGAGIGADGNGHTDGYGSTTQTCGTINIAGGTIIATGGGHYIMGEWALGGAGIGGSTTGDDGGVASTGKITISGGNVTATGGGYAAGIGGGHGGYVESIEITGGTVTAIAEYGAAIGSGIDTSAEPILTNCPTAISITGGTVTADGNIGYGGILYGTMSGGSLDIGTDASVALTDGHKIDHDSASNYAIIPVSLKVYDGRLTDGDNTITVKASQSGSIIGGAELTLNVSNYYGAADFNFVVPAANASGETEFTVSGDGFTASSESSTALNTNGTSVTIGKQLYPVTLTFLDDTKFATDTDYEVNDLTVTIGGNTPADGTIMATLPNTIEYHSASMGTMVIWLVAGTYNISVTAADLNDGTTMTGTIAVNGSATLNLLDNSSAEILGNLDLSYGPIKFYTENGTYKVDYYATADASEATTATVLISAPFVVKQSGDTTTNTITVTDWGTAVPLDLTIDGLNIETSTALSKDDNAGHIDINGSAVDLTLSDSSSLKSTYETRSEVTAALVSVDGSSSLTIDGTGSLTVYTNAYGAAIGGDYNSDVGSITIKGGTVDATSKQSAAAIGTGYAAGSGGHAVITIEGGTVNATVGYNNYLGQGTAIGAAGSQTKNANTASVTITGGEVNATGVIGGSNSSATVAISGGTVNATANTAKATIGGVAFSSDAGTYLSVTISGGTVNVANTGDGPAIGGSGNSEHYNFGTPKNASVTINGGTVTATNSSNTAAAIGASVGYYFDRTDVTISGGRVTAINSADGGVAIGGGYITSTSYTDPYTYSDVTITGGTVKATGIIGSAAQVAGPESTQYATVKITGGSVNGDVWAYSDESTNIGATNGTDDSVYMITATLPNADTAVTDASIDGVTYGFNDVYTNADGKLFLWLPDEAEANGTTAATFGGKDYTGKVETDNSGVFTAVCEHPESSVTYTAENNVITAACGDCSSDIGTITLGEPTNLIYDGNAKTATITNTVDGVSDPTITYCCDGGCVNAGDHTASITMGTATASVDFTITAMSLSSATAVQNGTLTYDGTAQTPTFTVTLGNATLTADDYDVTVTAQTNAGSYTATIAGKGNCSGTIADVAWEILPANIADTSITYAPLTYNGAEQTPVFTIKLGDYTLNASDYSVTVTAQINAGDYTATIVGNVNFDGNIDVDWSIGKKAADEVTSPIAATITYGQTLSEATLTSGWSWVDGTVIPTVMNNGYAAEITVDDSNYDYTSIDGYNADTHKITRTIAVTVEKAAPTITTEPYAAAGLVYDGSAKVLVNEGAVTGGSFVYSLTGNNFTATLPTATEAKEYTVYWRVAGDDNHNNSETFNFKVTIAKATPPALTIPTATAITYGEKLSASTLSDSSWAWVNGAIVPNASADYNAYIEVDDSNYDYTSVYGYDSANHRVVRDITVIINKATLTITANSYTIKVGDTLPTYAYDVTGLVNGDTLPFNVSLSCSATDSNTVGTYPITISGVVSDALASLYAPIYVNGTLTISEKDIQEIEADDVTLTYGETGKKITATTSGDGTISYSTTSDIISVAADGTITALKAGTATVTVKAAETDNYAEATKTVTVTVNKAAVTVTAKSYTIKVGDTLPTYAYDVAGLVNGETLPIDVTISCNAADSNTAGTYTITVSGAANSTNYTFAYANGTLTISNKLEQTITASDVTLTYGETGKKITATTNGNGAISYSTTSDVISVAADGTITALKAGTATVTINVAETDTYAAATKTVTVTVNKAAVTVTAKSYTIKVGEALPTYAYDVAGLVNGETLPIDVTISCNAADSNTAGTYDIIVSGAAASDNYTFSYVKGTLTVNEKEVVAAPTFTPASGTTFTSSQKVTISCATDGAKIYYTTDGTEPTTASTLYVGEFTISKTTTIKAIAVKDGMTDSSVVTATYTKKSSGGGGGYGGGGYRPTTPTNPEINDKSASWTTIADDISKLSIGSEVTIELNGNYDVPVEVIKAIAEKDAKVTFIVNSTRSWYLDGKEIDAPSAADLSILAIASLNADALRGEVGAKFRIDGTNIPTELTVAVDKKHAGKFANLYMKKENELVFVDNVKVNENGEVILPVSEKGDYVIMLCEYSDRKGDVSNDGITNALDASAILKDIVELEAAPNPAMRDYNGDGKINALDASDILKDIVNDRI